jgi:hypothetical protein
MKSYVDVAIRLVVEHEPGDDINECLHVDNGAEIFFGGGIDGEGRIEDSEIKDVVVAGECGDHGILHRPEGGTGRNVTLLHDPPA